MTLKIHVQGALQVRETAPDAVLVFIAPPSLSELERRLCNRDPCADPGDLARRLEIARDELALAPRYDYLVVNDTVAQAVNYVLEGVRYYQELIRQHETEE